MLHGLTLATSSSGYSFFFFCLRANLPGFQLPDPSLFYILNMYELAVLQLTQFLICIGSVPFGLLTGPCEPCFQSLKKI